MFYDAAIHEPYEKNDRNRVVAVKDTFNDKDNMGDSQVPSSADNDHA
jgi:hypothetical protein